MYKLEIYVTFKRDVLDPQGKAILKAAEQLNIKNLVDIKQGKYFVVTIKSVNNIKNACSVGKILSEKLLCNEVIEDYKIVSSKKL